MLLLSFGENFRMGITSFGDSAHPPCRLWASQNEHGEGVWLVLWCPAGLIVLTFL